MVTTIATVVIAFASASGPGPIAASVERHAADPIGPPSHTHADKWDQLARVPAGTDVVITTDEAPDLRRTLVVVDSNELTVINRSGQQQCPATERIVDLATQRPDLFVRSHLDVGFVAGDLDVRADRILFRGQVVCDPSVVFERFARSSLLSVRSPVRTRGSVLATAITVSVASTYAVFASWSAEGGAPLLTIGVPLGLGAAVWHGTKHTTQEIYYRRD